MIRDELVAMAKYVNKSRTQSFCVTVLCAMHAFVSKDKELKQVPLA